MYTWGKKQKKKKNYKVWLWDVLAVWQSLYDICCIKYMTISLSERPTVQNKTFTENVVIIPRNSRNCTPAQTHYGCGICTFILQFNLIQMKLNAQQQGCFNYCENTTLQITFMLNTGKKWNRNMWSKHSSVQWEKVKLPHSRTPSVALDWRRSVYKTHCDSLSMDWEIFKICWRQSSTHTSNVLHVHAYFIVWLHMHHR